MDLLGPLLPWVAQQISGLCFPTYLAWWWRPWSSHQTKKVGGKQIYFCVLTNNPLDSGKYVSGFSSVQISKGLQTVRAGGVHGLVCTNSYTSVHRHAHVAQTHRSMYTSTHRFKCYWPRILKPEKNHRGIRCPLMPTTPGDRKWGVVLAQCHIVA